MTNGHRLKSTEYIYQAKEEQIDILDDTAKVIKQDIKATEQLREARVRADQHNEQQIPKPHRTDLGMER